MPSQNQIILATLHEAVGNAQDGWVPMPDLMRAADSGNVHSRINDLRHAGHEIENKVERESGSTRNKSFYRLAPKPEPALPAQEPAPPEQEQPATATDCVPECCGGCGCAVACEIELATA